MTYISDPSVNIRIPSYNAQFLSSFCIHWGFRELRQSVGPASQTVGQSPTNYAGELAENSLKIYEILLNGAREAHSWQNEMKWMVFKATFVHI